MLDAELAATLWLLIEARVPLVVAAEAQARRQDDAARPRSSTSCRPTSRDRRARRRGRDLRLAAAGVRARLARASPEPDRDAGSAADPPRRRPSCSPTSCPTTLPAYTWGAAARVAVRAASIGYGLAATIHADSLDEVFDALRRPPVRLADDELSHLGVVLSLRRLDDGRRRVVAAHYVRPIVRDAHGHLQRLGPAVLATWDPAEDASSISAGGSPRSSRVASDAGRATSRSSWTAVGPSSRRSSAAGTSDARRGSDADPRVPPGRGV